MLSIGLIGVHQEKYYTALSREDYYTEGGEPPGEWSGAGAEALGLSGEVRKNTLSRLFQGFGLDGETKLVRNAGSPSRRAGFDFTFNAPKSVSVLFSQAAPEHRRVLQEAHAEAVRAALHYIEQHAAQVRFGKDGTEVVRASLTAALFEHSTARLVPGESIPDPHLHTHAVISNFGFTSDGRSGTLDSRELFRHKMAAGVLYRAELFRQVERRLGLTVSRRGKFLEVDGVPEELLEVFSKRRKAIEAELGEGAEYGKATDKATLHTRTHKPTVDRARFFEEWKEVGRAARFHVDEPYFEAALAGAPERDVAALIQAATDRATLKVTSQQSHFAEREYVRAVAEELEDKGVGAFAILDGARAFLASEKCVPVGESNGEKRYTTKEMLELEERMLASARELFRRSHRVRSEHTDRVLVAREGEGKTLTDEQRLAFLHLTQGRALSLVRGVAGAGKTFMLAAAREAFEAEGYKVIGAALAGRAAKQLEEDSGIRSGTIHSLIFSLDRGATRLTEQTVLVIDEAAMVGTRQLERLVKHVRLSGAKLVLVGDDRQLQAVEAGAPFASIRRRFGAAEMVEIRRQREAWAREAVQEFSRGDARAALRKFVERGLVDVMATKTEAVSKLVRDFRETVRTSGFEETLVLTGTRAEARRVNREVQLLRRLEGELGEERFDYGEESFSVGDRVLFKKNSKRLGVLNGDRALVAGISERGMTVRLDSGERVTIHEDSADLVSPQLGYAATTHSSQGATVDRCFVLAGGSMQDREATYVQASRARVETRVYTDETSAGPEMEELLRSMERSRAKDLASDLLDLQGQGQELEAA